MRCKELPLDLTALAQVHSLRLWRAYLLQDGHVERPLACSHSHACHSACCCRMRAAFEGCVQKSGTFFTLYKELLQVAVYV